MTSNEMNKETTRLITERQGKKNALKAGQTVLNYTCRKHYNSLDLSMIEIIVKSGTTILNDYFKATNQNLIAKIYAKYKDDRITGASIKITKNK